MQFPLGETPFYDPQDRPRWSQNRPKSAPRPFKTTNFRLRRPKITPRPLQVRSKIASRSLKTSPRMPKTTPRPPQNPQDATKRPRNRPDPPPDPPKIPQESPDNPKDSRVAPKRNSCAGISLGSQSCCPSPRKLQKNYFNFCKLTGSQTALRPTPSIICDFHRIPQEFPKNFESRPVPHL